MSGTCSETTSAPGRSAVEVGVAAGEDGLGAEGLDEPCGLAADPSRTDDQHRLALEALAEHELERELPRLPSAHETVALRHPAQQRQHQRQRELRGRAREHVGRVRDHDAAAAGRIEVDVVHADRVVRDDLQLRPRSVEIGVVDRDGEHRDDPVGADGRRDELEVGLELVHDLRRNGIAEVDAEAHRAHHP